MRLFGTPSERLIKTYHDKLTVVVIDHLSVDLDRTAVHRFKVKGFHFVATREETDQTRLTLMTDSNKTDFSVTCLQVKADPAIMPPSSYSVDTQVPTPNTGRGTLLSVADARAKEIDLIWKSDIRVRSVDLRSFDVQATRFSFSPLREERPTSLFERVRGHGKRIHVPPVRVPEPPAIVLHKEDLKERLRRLLTPPIHEILSDPQLALPQTPFQYQAIGIKWLYDRESALLADEMGLGKTMQAIIAARLLWRDGRIKQILIVCPKSLRANWKKELAEWWPRILPFTWVVERDHEWTLRQSTNDVAIKIINYESLPGQLGWIKEKPPYHDLIIIDEAQRIKNPDTKASQAVKALGADRRWALTGTPLENSIGDFVSIFEFVRPGLVSEDASAKEIRKATAPYMLRRRQEEVQLELPEKLEQDIEVELDCRQREAYDRAERDGVIELNDQGESITVTHVFALINKLRQICNFDPVSGESAKGALLIEELEEILESGRKALIFGHFVDEPFGLVSLANRIAGAFKGRPRPLELHGKIRDYHRVGAFEHIVKQFQTDPAHQVLLLNYKVGGLGLNLQTANYVFLFDRWWNPAVEDQAIGRCHRIGQMHKVFAKRFYCKGTIEERILQKLSEKRRLFSNVIDDERPTAASLGLSEEEIFSLFKDLAVRPRSSTPSGGRIKLDLDNLDHKEFEKLVAHIYEKEGYEAEVTGRSHDGGIDILAERVSASGKDRIIVQCKHQKQNVSVGVVRELWGVLNSDASLTQCALVTIAGFTAEARQFAAEKRVTLIDRKKLEELVQKHGIAELVKPPMSERPTASV